MARRKATEHSELRERMARRTEAFAAWWADNRPGAGPGSHSARIFAATADRWRSDEPMYVGAWELPDDARGSIYPGTNVWVLGDGSIVHAGDYTPPAPNLRAVD